MANSISEWLIEPGHHVFAAEIEQPVEELFTLHQLIQNHLKDTNREFDPFWISSKGRPYVMLAVDNEKGAASYVVGVRDKQDAPEQRVEVPNLKEIAPIKIGVWSKDKVDRDAMLHFLQNALEQAGLNIRDLASDVDDDDPANTTAIALDKGDVMLVSYTHPSGT